MLKDGGVAAIFAATATRTKRTPPGYQTALSVLTLGRRAFFGDSSADLPTNRSALLQQDDLTPQFGYVGDDYARTGVLLLGINPGNGRETVHRSVTDEQMMPPLIRFAQSPSVASFREAQRAYQAACTTWHVWRRHCAEIIGAGRLSFSGIAYSNCLPWRTGSESRFADTVAERAASLYAYPLIDELAPRVVICLGKRAGEVLQTGRRALPRVIVWNRAQAATAKVRSERQRVANEIFALLGQR